MVVFVRMGVNFHGGKFCFGVPPWFVGLACAIPAFDWRIEAVES